MESGNDWEPLSMVMYWCLFNQLRSNCEDSKIELRSGYYQLNIISDVDHKMVFWTCYGPYEVWWCYVDTHAVLWVDGWSIPIMPW